MTICRRYRIVEKIARRVLRTIVVTIFCAGLVAGPVQANPYLAKSGERPLAIRIATCAVSGGFAHL